MAEPPWDDTGDIFVPGLRYRLGHIRESEGEQT
jgi:hypothetical protein